LKSIAITVPLIGGLSMLIISSAASTREIKGIQVIASMAQAQLRPMNLNRNIFAISLNLFCSL
jgi:hypothetical protein